MNTKEKRPQEHSPKAAQNGSSGKDGNASQQAAARSAVWQVVLLPVTQISPNPFQPRTSFDPAEMEELVSSVRAHGVLQPVTVRTNKRENSAKQTDSVAKNGHAGDDKNNGQKNGATGYHLVTGERRLRACREAGRKTIPAIVRDDLSDVAAAELALVENVQRSNLNVMDEAAGYKRLMVQFQMKEERIAKKVGKSVATIKETMKLLALPEPVQKMLAIKSLTPSHGQQLLRLAAFESVCVLVAQKAVKDKLTATSLATALLPNVQELKQKGWLIELDYKTQFDWKEQCGNCPHKAYVQSGYSSYCLKPLEWKKKNEAAAALKQQEASRVMEQAREQGRTAVDTEKLPQGSYRDLTYATLPAGCSGACPCRGETTDPRDATRKVPVCLDPKRFNELVQAERQAHEEERQRCFTALWREATEVLGQEAESGTWNKIALLLARPVLFGHAYHYGNPDVWITLVRQVARELDILLPWEKVFDAETDDAETLAQLAEIEPNRLLHFVACLMLAHEAQEAIRFASVTPDLDLVLGRTSVNQPELPGEETETPAEMMAAPETATPESSAEGDWEPGTQTGTDRACAVDVPDEEATLGEDPFVTTGLSEPWDDEEQGDEQPDGAEWDDPWDADDMDTADPDAQGECFAKPLSPAPTAEASGQAESSEGVSPASVA